MRHPGLLTSVLLLTLLVTACAGPEHPDVGAGGSATGPVPDGASPDDSGDTAPTTSAAEAVTPTVPGEAEQAVTLWRTDELRPLSGPVLVDDTLVLYTLEGLELRITGVAADDGRVLWSHAATPSVRPRGQDQVVEQVTGQVVHLTPAQRSEAPAGSAPAHVILRDPVTGEETLTSTVPLSHADLPSPCPHDEQQVCVTVPVNGQWSTQALTADGGLDDVPATGTPGWTGIGPLGLTRRAVDGTQIGREVDGELLWEADTTELFGEGHSTDTGWSFQAFGDDSVLAGTVGIRRGAQEDQEPWELTAYRTVGLDAESGERLWERAATSIFCDAGVSGEENDPLLACVWRDGEFRITPDGVTYHHLDVDLVRLDPLTGRAVWTVPLGATRDGADPAPPVVQLVGPQEVAVATSDGVVVIDTESGAARPATSGDTSWVENRELVEVSIPDSGEGPGEDEISSWGRYLLQDGDGAVTDRVEWPLPATIGVALEDGTVRVVADPEGLTAYAAP